MFAHARYFNNISVDTQNKIVFKSSSNVDKIISEYLYYYELPVKLQKYFLKPYDLKINKGSATYSTKYIKKYLMSDLNTIDFKRALAKILEYKDACYEFTKPAKKSDSINIVIDKTASRISELKQTEVWNSFKHKEVIEKYDLDPELILKRLTLAFNYYSNRRLNYKLIVSHGDLYPANVLFENKRSIKMIDPKGVDYLYMDEYYDYAKLSHSILGGYELIVDGKYGIIINGDLINIKLNTNKSNINFFKKKIKKYNIDYDLLRVYEASLFLSMLPLHIDNEDRMFAFIINSHCILKELKF